MKFIMLVCNDSTLSQQEADQVELEPVEPWLAEMEARGVRLMGERLRPTSEAVSVRVRKGEVLLSDGPFAETKELVGGFDLLDCKDMAEAIEVAAKHPMARLGRLELRALWDE